MKELYRIMKPGATCVIVDGFTKVNRSAFGPVFKYCIDETCKGWALPCFPAIDPMLAQMRLLGFERILAEDISWKIAPTAVHSPLCVAGFICKKWWEGEKLNQVRLGHLKSCVLGLLLGMSRRQFGYYMISAQKPG